MTRRRPLTDQRAPQDTRPSPQVYWLTRQDLTTLGVIRVEARKALASAIKGSGPRR